MAGNKVDTGFKKEVVTHVKMTYIGLYNTPVTFEGTPEQAIRHLSSKL